MRLSVCPRLPGGLLLAAAVLAPVSAAPLSSLSLSSGALSPAFGSQVYNYTASVPSTVTSVQVRATTAIAGATIRINGVVTASGAQSAPISLVQGQNTITIAATGFFTHTYRVVVTRAGSTSNTPPTVDITSPSAPTTINLGQAITLAGTATDTQDGALSAGIRWSSSINGSLGTGASITTSALSAGAHTITAAVTDSSGASAQDTVAVTVNAPPTVSILSPANGSSHAEGAAIVFSASASDPEDGVLNASVRWTSNVSGQFGAGTPVTVSTLPPGVHTITASVTDSRGLSRSASINVSITGASSGTRPNILLIVADDLGAEASSLYPVLSGATGAVSMPNLEGLAAGGLVFNNAWATPLCSPTRAALLTGLHGNRTGVLNVGQVLPVSTTTIFDTLASQSPARYNMAVFGKWHLGGPVGSAQHVRDSGVPAFKGILGGGVNNYFNWTATDINGVASNVTTYATTAITDYAINFIQTHQNTRPQDPWFVYVPYNAPHFPNQVPPANLHSVNVGGLQPGTTSNTVPVYKAMIQALDTEMGRLLRSVNLSNTVVIFVGDNGTPSNVKDSPSGVRGSKQSVYEGGVRVPLVIAGTGVTRTGREDSVVAITDLYATVMSLAGIPVSQINHSYNLKPVLDGSGTSGRAQAYTELCGSGYSGQAVRDTRYKLMYANGTWALYDLLSDPLEGSNLYNNGAYASVQTGLKATLDAMKAGATAGCFP